MAVKVGKLYYQMYKGKLIRQVKVISVDGDKLELEALNGDMKGTRYKLTNDGKPNSLVRK